MKKKMRGIVALGAALTIGLGSSAVMAQKATDAKKEVKRTKAEQVDIDSHDTLGHSTGGRVAGCGRHIRSQAGIEHDVRAGKTRGGPIMDEAIED